MAPYHRRAGSSGCARAPARRACRHARQSVRHHGANDNRSRRQDRRGRDDQTWTAGAGRSRCARTAGWAGLGGVEPGARSRQGLDRQHWRRSTRGSARAIRSVNIAKSVPHFEYDCAWAAGPGRMLQPKIGLDGPVRATRLHNTSSRTLGSGLGWSTRPPTNDGAAPFQPRRIWLAGNASSVTPQDPIDAAGAVDSHMDSATSRPHDPRTASERNGSSGRGVCGQQQWVAIFCQPSARTDCRRRTGNRCAEAGRPRARAARSTSVRIARDPGERDGHRLRRLAVVLASRSQLMRSSRGLAA